MPPVDPARSSQSTLPGLVDIRRFIEAQNRERYKAFVVHGAPLTGKSTFARKLATKVEGGVYWDVLAHVAADPQLSSTVDLLDAPSLRDMTVAHANETGAKLLLVDEIDFLVYIWGGDLTELKYAVEKLSTAQSPTVIGIILQTHPDLEAWSLTNRNTSQSRILRLEEIGAI